MEDIKRVKIKNPKAKTFSNLQLTTCEKKFKIKKITEGNLRFFFLKKKPPTPLCK